MNGLSSGTGRFAPPKIEFSCTCGKRYRVSAAKAGKKVRCKRCRVKIQVPKEGISMRSRKAILEEFGIDAEQAEKAYEKSKKHKGYNCTLCDAKISEDQLKTAYGAQGLVCSRCQRTAEKKSETREEKKLDSWTAASSQKVALRKAGAFSTLFFVGTAGFVHTFFTPAGWVTGAVALTVALIGARSIYNAEYTPSEDSE